MSVSVCLSVCLPAYLENLSADSPIFVHVECDRGSVLLRWCCDALCTSGFEDDVTISHNGFYGASRVFLNGESVTAETTH